MINGVNVIAVSYAKGTSQRLPHKHLKPLGASGRPVVLHALEPAIESRYVDHIRFITDCPVIRHTIEEAHGDRVMVLDEPVRGDGDEADRAKTLIDHATVDRLFNPSPCIIVRLPANAVTTITGVVDSAVEKLATLPPDAMVNTVHRAEVTNHPLSAMTMEDNRLCFREREAPAWNRRPTQEWPEVWFHNAVVEVQWWPCQLDARRYGLPIPAHGYVDIDSEDDLRLAERMLGGVLQHGFREVL